MFMPLLLPPPRLCDRWHMSFNKIIQKFMMGLEWHFQEMLGLGQGRAH